MTEMKGNKNKVKAEVAKDKALETLLVIILALVVIYWLTGLRFFLLILFIAGVAGLSSSLILHIIHRLWMKLAEVMGLTTGKIMLTLVFVLVLIPLSFLSRIFGKPSIQLKRKEGSYYKERNHSYKKEDLENVW
jgi:hypothetical protein